MHLNYIALNSIAQIDSILAILFCYALRKAKVYQTSAIFYL